VQLLDEAEEEVDPAEHELQVEVVEAPVAAEYVPASQLVQKVEAVPAAYLPEPQRVQADDADAEYVPATQAMQESAVVWPGFLEYLPATQWVQTEAPAAEYLPARQSVQAVAPDIGENFPAPQGVQLPPSSTGPAFPAVQFT
jgi:hypothetical protein